MLDGKESKANLNTHVDRVCHIGYQVAQTYIPPVCTSTAPFSKQRLFEFELALNAKQLQLERAPGKVCSGDVRRTSVDSTGMPKQKSARLTGAVRDGDRDLVTRYHV